MEEDNKNQNYRVQPFQRKIIYQNKEVEHPQRISNWMAFFLITLAVIVDILELIITYAGLAFGGLLSLIVSIGATMSFGFTFAILKINKSGNSKLLVTQWATVIGENIPYLDAIPINFLWTIGMIITIIMVRSEDKNGLIGNITSKIPNLKSLSNVK